MKIVGIAAKKDALVGGMCEVSYSNRTTLDIRNHQYLLVCPVLIEASEGNYISVRARSVGKVIGDWVGIKRLVLFKNRLEATTEGEEIISVSTPFVSDGYPILLDIRKEKKSADN